MAPDDDDIGIDRGDPHPVPFLKEIANDLGRVRIGPQVVRKRWIGNPRGRPARLSVTRDAGDWRPGTGGRVRDRRVAVMTTWVKLEPAAPRTAAHAMATAAGRHLRYLERDGVTRDGDHGCPYSATEDRTDGRAFIVRGRADPRQFRFVVSADDGAALGDLRPFTRELMRRIAGDLETTLDWIAVDHFNTGHPHTHVLVRGVTGDGKGLFIARDYLTNGARHRAREIATAILGPESEREAAHKLTAEVDAERLTQIDRMLIAEQRDRGFVDAGLGAGEGRVRDDHHAVIRRLKRLQAYGLAEETARLRFVLAPDAATTLTAMGARRDAIEAVHRALQDHGLTAARGPERYVLHGTAPPATVTGRVIGKGVCETGLAGDGFGARVHVVVDGADGLVHHLECAGATLEDVRRGMIVAVVPVPDPGDAAAHPRTSRDPGSSGPGVQILSRIGLEQQIASPGPTWLDRELVATGRIPAAGTGFGAELAAALASRAERLADVGHAQRRDREWLVARDLVTVLERQEVGRTGRDLARARGRTYLPVHADERIAGTLAGAAGIAGRRWAMIDDGVSFSLVPWQDTLERRVGRYVCGIARSNGGVDWSFGRNPGLQR